METGVMIERKRQVRSVGRMGPLIVGDLLFGREWKFFREFIQAANLGGKARRGEFFGVEPIGRDQRGEQAAQSVKL